MTRVPLSREEMARRLVAAVRCNVSEERRRARARRRRWAAAAIAAVSLIALAFFVGQLARHL